MKIDLDKHELLYYIEGCARGSHLRQYIWRDVIEKFIPQMSTSEMDFTWWACYRNLWDNYFHSPTDFVPCGAEDYLQALAALNRNNHSRVTAEMDGKHTEYHCYNFRRELYLFGKFSRLWGGSDWEFLDENENVETVAMYGYCTNDAKRAGHFSGRKVSSMFRSMYKKLCPTNHNQIGRYISHCNDWWGDGSGGMLFIRTGYYNAFEEWARKK